MTVRVLAGGGGGATERDDDFNLVTALYHFNGSGGGQNATFTDSSNENHNEPYIGIDYKLFKNKKLRIFFNTSESMKILGLMMPIFNIGKKHMNHNMDHSNHN